MFFQKTIYYAIMILFLLYSCAPKPIETAIKYPIMIDIIPSNKSIVNEITRIKVDINIDKIKKISFFLNDTLVHQDNKYPYYYDWNTSSYSDNSEHSIYVNIFFEDEDFEEDNYMKMEKARYGVGKTEKEIKEELEFEEEVSKKLKRIK